MWETTPGADDLPLVPACSIVSRKACHTFRGSPSSRISVVFLLGQWRRNRTPLLVCDSCRKGNAQPAVGRANSPILALLVSSIFFLLLSPLPPGGLPTSTLGQPVKCHFLHLKGLSWFLTETQNGHPRELTKHSLDPLRAEKSRPAG